MKAYGEIEEQGWTIKVGLPENADELREGWEVVFTRGDDTHTVMVPMAYEPRFGPDVEDVNAMDAAVDKELKKLAKLTG